MPLSSFWLCPGYELSGTWIATLYISLSLAASVWQDARQDVMSVFINEATTRVELENLCSWRRTGLPVEDSGTLLSEYSILEDIVEDNSINNNIKPNALYGHCQ